MLYGIANRFLRDVIQVARDRCIMNEQRLVATELARDAKYFLYFVRHMVQTRHQAMRLG